MNSLVPVYQGKLPEAIARDFEFATVYKARVIETIGNGHSVIDNVSPEKIQKARDAALADAQSPELYNQTLDEAIRDIVKQGTKDRGTIGVEIIADVNVVRNYPHVIKPSEYVYFRGKLELVVEAIGYKRKTPVAQEAQAIVAPNRL